MEGLGLAAMWLALKYGIVIYSSKYSHDRGIFTWYFRKKFRKKYSFSLSRFEEVMSAIDSAEPEFRHFLAQNFDSMEFSILCDGKTVNMNSDCLKNSPSRIDLVPAAKGSLEPFTMFLIMLFINVGIAIIQAASSVPKPEMDNNSEQAVKTKSYEFNGEANVQKSKVSLYLLDMAGSVSEVMLLVLKLGIAIFLNKVSHDKRKILWIIK